MIEPEITKDLEIFTQQIMKDEGISEYDLHIEGQTEKGTNYGSEIVFYSVTPKNVKKDYNLVMKTTKRAENLRQATSDGIADIRETFMYAQVFPALRKMLEESRSSFQLENISKTYLVSQKYRHETVIMDNLRSLGYRLWDKNIPMNLEHIKTVMTNYGKYHAASMALRHRKPEVFRELTRDMHNLWENFAKNEVLKNLFAQYTIDAFKLLKTVGLNHITEKLEGIPEKTCEIHAQKIDEDDKIVITHGDCWINNIMFKYENTESMKPTGVCFLDFQLATHRSPVTDLSYFLYTACDGQTLSDEFENLLNLYYQSLSSTLRSLDVEPEKVFSFDKLKEHWKKYAIQGLLMGTMVLKVQLSNKDEAMDFSDLGKEGVDYTELMVKDIENVEDYKNRLIGAYKHYEETCLKE